MVVDYEDLGKRIRKKRKKMGITQKKLAELADVSSQHVSNVERAVNKVGLETLVAVAGSLQISLDELLCSSHVVSDHVYANEAGEIMQGFTKLEKKLFPTALKHYRYGISTIRKEMEKEFRNLQ